MSLYKTMIYIHHFHLSFSHQFINAFHDRFPNVFKSPFLVRISTNNPFYTVGYFPVLFFRSIFIYLLNDAISIFCIRYGKQYIFSCSVFWSSYLLKISNTSQFLYCFIKQLCIIIRQIVVVMAKIPAGIN